MKDDAFIIWRRQDGRIIGKHKVNSILQYRKQERKNQHWKKKEKNIENNNRLPPLWHKLTSFICSGIICVYDGVGEFAAYIAFEGI